MKVGLTGKAFSGKSTIFNALMELKEGSDTKDRRIGVIPVPDERIDYLSSVFTPKKTTYAAIQVEEPEVSLETSKELPNLLGTLRDMDTLCLVLGAFSDPDVSPLADLRDMLDELKLADLSIIEKRLDRLERECSKSGESERLQTFRAHLENQDGLIRTLELDDDDDKLFGGFRFLTEKPMIAVVNQSEDLFLKKAYPDLREFAKRHDIHLIEMCAPLEWEISQLDSENRREFLDDLNLDQPAASRFIRTCYQLLNYISFFTVGADEVRAWPVTRGTTAVKAAGKIHSDIERGFIRAEVIAYPDFCQCGSESEAKARGKAPLEGKTYIVRDGDLMNYKFNV
ncbi:DUF933 domain-containing protein [Fibrobacterota bacterium]